MIRKLANVFRGQLKYNGNSFQNVSTTWYSETSKAFYCTKSENESQAQNDDSAGRGRGKSNIRKPPLPAIQNPFANVTNKTKESYLAMLEIFEERDVHRRNHVEFIYAALRNMADFGVEHDIEVYKALINVMPKGKFIPTNVFQAEFMHYPKQQQCIIDLLEQMEDLGVIPDYEMEAMLLNVFGRRGHPLRKYWRMMYWMPKFKNLSPWPLPNPIPDDTLNIAQLAVERMCTVDLRSKISVYETKNVQDSIDDTWIVSGMSAEQSQLLRDHPRDKAVYIEGPFLIWLRNRSINYFTLRADPDPNYLQSLQEEQEDQDDVSRLKAPFFGSAIPRSKNAVSKNRSVHQQEDGTIFAICATGTSTKDSLLSWIRLLESNGNPTLGEIPVLFRFKSVVTAKAIEIEDKAKSDNLQSNPSSKTTD
ncbi:PREDICTED: evolutionarily conserved signaling intermediate in Toll pathway, mitochondrial [Bactrocera latifrons]|uniref:Evolutionarily conserved signaling intermediate in Toll pathway, mitochondrial n=1 Tax=Bactrocera latifrons TaxID=174628 RepID=A0A0K8U9F0_BACLA|nr:PREDICTED: evolutionarily conserved signaling intermediate in Toll pathway, mitochondrial [Bactrocera latifrons]